MNEAVKIRHDPEVRPEELAEVQAVLLRVAPAVEVTAEEPGPQNVVDWALPALIIISIVKPIFEAFLGEFGVDLAKSFKEALSKLHRRRNGNGKRWLSLSEAKQAASHMETFGGLPPPTLGRYGPLFSISVVLESTEVRLHRVSFVIPSLLDESELARAIDALPAIAKAAIEEEEKAEDVKQMIYGARHAVFGYDKDHWTKVFPTSGRNA